MRKGRGASRPRAPRRQSAQGNRRKGTTLLFQLRLLSPSPPTPHPPPPPLQVNERKRHSESYNEVLRIQRSLLPRSDPVGPLRDIPSLSAPERRVMGSCWALLKTEAGPAVVRFILFNDALLIAVPERRKAGVTICNLLEECGSKLQQACAASTSFSSTRAKDSRNRPSMRPLAG